MCRRARQAMAVAFLSLVSVGLSVAPAQSQQSALPANWQQLSPTDFGTLVQGYFQQGTFQSLSPTDQSSLAAQGALLFSQVNISNTSLSYQTLEALQRVGASQLDQWAVAQAKSAITARQDDWTGKPYAEMFAKVMLMTRLQVPDSISTPEARRWVLAGGTADQVRPNDLVFDFVRQMFADFKVIDRTFEVSWVGKINAPQSGDYTFSISPIDLNSGHSSPGINVSMTVLIAGQAIITARPPAPPDPLSPTYQPGARPTSNWVVRSNPVTLTAGTPVDLQAILSVEAPHGIPPGALHAMLLWEGPGITKQLVPTSAVSQAQTGTSGFQATYSWRTRGQQQSLSRTDPVIDFSWTGSAVLVASDTTSASQSADAMWQAMTAPAFLASYANATPSPKLHPFLREPYEASCGLSTARRQAFLDLLVQNPTLLDAVDATHAAAFFQAFRVGTPDQALTVFGTWATRQADLTCALATDRFFDGDTRLALASMAILTTQQMPTQATSLQNDFLQLPDGRCSLPVAYTLTYSYLGLGNLSNWMSTLDAKLADPTVTGDLRVNWLLARAHAQEFTRTAPLHYPFGQSYPSSWPVDGRSYLFQALKAAQTPSVQVRVAKEIAGRLVSAAEFQKVKDFLTQLSSSLPADQKAIVAGWQQQIDSFQTAAAQSTQNQPAEAKKGYIMTLQARRAQAASQGDSASVSLYDALISAASNQQ
jgi:hypothetical protein